MSKIIIPESRADFRRLQTLVEQAEPEYPGIGAWWNKIKYDFDYDRRGLLILNKERHVVGGTIIKTGFKAKFCSMRITEDARGNGYGQQLWDATIKLARDLGYDRLHFTLPGDVWARGWFARQKGVQQIGWLKPQYFRRNDIDEIVCICKLEQ